MAQDNNNESDNDSVLLQVNDNQRQIEFDKLSRTIIRLFICNLIIICNIFAFLIMGAVDYFTTNTDNIVYNYYGKILFQYYYIINIGWYVVFLAISLNLILYIICYSTKSTPIRDISFFKLLKLNMIIFTFNIVVKITYCICILILTSNNINNINSIPKYYNYITIEIMYFMLTIVFNNKFINNIDIIIDMQ